MSVLPSDIVAYGAADMPEADGAAVGGAVDFTSRVAFYDIAPTGTVDAVSSSASDTATQITYFGRDGTGVVQSQIMTLNGTTPVIGSQSLERLLYAAASGGGGLTKPIATVGGTAAVGDLALYAHTAVISAHTAQAGSANHSGTNPALFKLQSGDGAAVALGQIIRITGGTGQNQLRQIIAVSGYGTDVAAVNRDWGTVPDATSTYNIVQGMLFEISPNQVKFITRCFATAAADVPAGSARYFFEKVFVVNNNVATALTAAQIEIASETPTLPTGALLDIALCTALNDTNTANPRQQASSFVPIGCGAFVAQPALVPVPGGGNLPSGAAPNSIGAQGVWLRLTLSPGTAAYKGSADLRTQGTTT
jgi:hypothetical protein